MRSILFVCTANICRSPTAEGVFRKMLAGQSKDSAFEVASVGTHDYHVGSAAFPIAVEVAHERGVDLSQHVARRIKSGDFDHYDLILAMDKSNLASLRTIAPTRCKQKIELLLEYGDEFHAREIPDPYGGDRKDFELAFTMIQDGCGGLLKLLVR